MSAENIRKRVQNNPVEDLVLGINKKILKNCTEFYIDSDYGLITLGKTVGLNVICPQKKVTVMIIGNHSAGKSSYINWYIEEHILKTGVAIETQGFAFIISGKKRETLTASATAQLFPHLKNFSAIKEMTDFLCTEVSSSKQRQFSVVTFVDTPGLIDTNMKCSFNVNEAVQYISEMCDLVFVFFDPMGQALCRRTLDIVESISENHPEKLKLFLSKADEAGSESDRQKVLMQVVQELCKRPKLNKICTDMPTIFVPNLSKPVRCSNQIEESCKLIDKAIDQTVQKALDQLEKDHTDISNLMDEALSRDEISKSSNKKAKIRAMMISSAGFLLPVLLFVQLALASAPRTAIEEVVGKSIAKFIIAAMEPCTKYWSSINGDSQVLVLAATLILSGVCLLLSRFLAVQDPTLARKNRSILLDEREYIETNIKPQTKKMRNEYLRQNLSEYDIQN